MRILKAELQENDKAALTINTSALRRRGTWSNPDITKILVRAFPLLRTHKMFVATYALKQWRHWDIKTVSEAASQLKFAHESYLVLEWAKGGEVGGLDELLAVCCCLGVGLLTLHPHFSSYRCAVQLEAQRQAVSEGDLEEFLSYFFEDATKAGGRYEARCNEQGL